MVSAVPDLMHLAQPSPNQGPLAHALAHIDAICSCDASALADKLAGDPYAEPGHTAALLLGDGWTVYEERLVCIPTEYLGQENPNRSHVEQWQSIALRNTDGVFIAFRVKWFSDERHRGFRTSYYWDGLTPIQRTNAILTALVAIAAGLGPDGLITNLAEIVESKRHGTDPTNWIDAARMVIEREGGSESIDTALFLASLTSRRFAALLNG